MGQVVIESTIWLYYCSVRRERTEEGGGGGGQGKGEYLEVRMMGCRRGKIPGAHVVKLSICPLVSTARPPLYLSLGEQWKSSL